MEEGRCERVRDVDALLANSGTATRTEEMISPNMEPKKSLLNYY